MHECINPKNFLSPCILIIITKNFDHRGTFNQLRILEITYDYTHFNKIYQQHCYQIQNRKLIYLFRLYPLKRFQLFNHAHIQLINILYRVRKLIIYILNCNYNRDSQMCYEDNLLFHLRFLHNPRYLTKNFHDHISNLLEKIQLFLYQIIRNMRHLLSFHFSQNYHRKLLSFLLNKYMKLLQCLDFKLFFHLFKH